MFVEGVGFKPELLAKLLERPKLATAVCINWDREQTFFAAPPFGGVQTTLALKRRASPAAKLCFPLFPRKIGLADQRSVRGSEVFFRAGDGLDRWNYAPIFQRLSNAGKGAHVYFGPKSIRQDDAESLGDISQNGIHIGVRKHHSRHIIAPRAKAAAGAFLKADCDFKRPFSHSAYNRPHNRTVPPQERFIYAFGFQTVKLQYCNAALRGAYASPSIRTRRPASVSRNQNSMPRPGTSSTSPSLTRLSTVRCSCPMK